jgi:hypothetical protein
MRTPKNLLDSGKVRDSVGTLQVLVTNGPGETTFVTNIAGNYDGEGEATLHIYAVEPEGTSVGGETSAHTMFGPEAMYPPDHHTFLFETSYPGIILDKQGQSVQAKAVITGGGIVTIGITGAKDGS